MGAVLVGSACPAAWLIVTVGGVGSKVTVLSVLVEAVFPLPAASVAPPAGIVAITVPPVVDRLSTPLYSSHLAVTSAVFVPHAVPPITTSLPLYLLCGWVHPAVQSFPTRRSSDLCPAAWLIVTVGGVGSKVTVLSVLVEAVFPLPAASVAPPAGIVAITVPPV